MLDELLDLFERDRRRTAGRRPGIRGLLDRFSDHDRDERPDPRHAGSRRDDHDDEGWDEDDRADRRRHRRSHREALDWED